jgi:hypothetical protein
MPKPLLATALAALLLLSAGCFFSRKKAAPKENTAIAAEVEESFRRRWLEKRAGELAAADTAAEAARTQAEAEFRERYGFMRAGQKN